jgi:hypothetical protein
MLVNAAKSILSCVQQLTPVDVIIADKHSCHNNLHRTLFNVLAYSAKLYNQSGVNVRVLIEISAVNHEVFSLIVIEIVRYK